LPAGEEEEEEEAVFIRRRWWWSLLVKIESTHRRLTKAKTQRFAPRVPNTP